MQSTQVTFIDLGHLRNPRAIQISTKNYTCLSTVRSLCLRDCPYMIKLSAVLELEIPLRFQGRVFETDTEFEFDNVIVVLRVP